MDNLAVYAAILRQVVRAQKPVTAEQLISRVTYRGAYTRTDVVEAAKQLLAADSILHSPAGGYVPGPRPWRWTVLQALLGGAHLLQMRTALKLAGRHYGVWEEVRAEIDRLLVEGAVVRSAIGRGPVEYRATGIVVNSYRTADPCPHCNGTGQILPPPETPEQLAPDLTPESAVQQAEPAWINQTIDGLARHVLYRQDPDLKIVSYSDALRTLQLAGRLDDYQDALREHGGNWLRIEQAIQDDGMVCADALRRLGADMWRVEYSAETETSGAGCLRD